MLQLRLVKAIEPVGADGVVLLVPYQLPPLNHPTINAMKCRVLSNLGTLHYLFLYQFHRSLQCCSCGFGTPLYLSLPTGSSEVRICSCFTILYD